MKAKIALGGGCHWCTESVFLQLKGVEMVKQGWISSLAPNQVYSEAIIIDYNEDLINLETIVSIHLHTHSCTSQHALRDRYRSAIYTYSDKQLKHVQNIISKLQADFDDEIITVVLPFVTFKENIEKYQNYYEKNKGNQFCKRYIDPKFKLLRKRYGEFTKH